MKRIRIPQDRMQRTVWIEVPLDLQAFTDAEGFFVTHTRLTLGMHESLVFIAAPSSSSFACRGSSWYPCTISSYAAFMASSKVAIVPAVLFDEALRILLLSEGPLALLVITPGLFPPMTRPLFRASMSFLVRNLDHHGFGRLSIWTARSRPRNGCCRPQGVASLYSDQDSAVIELRPVMRSTCRMNASECPPGLGQRPAHPQTDTKPSPKPMISLRILLPSLDFCIFLHAPPFSDVRVVKAKGPSSTRNFHFQT